MIPRIELTGVSKRFGNRQVLDGLDVAVMPGESFGASLAGWLRVSLTQDDALVAAACDRILAFTARQLGAAA